CHGTTIARVPNGLACSPAGRKSPHMTIGGRRRRNMPELESSKQNAEVDQASALVSPTKRRLLKAGWVAPVVGMASLPHSGFAKHLSGSKGTDGEDENDQGDKFHPPGFDDRMKPPGGGKQ